MLPNLKVPEHSTLLKPVIISSPLVRSGTTLLQRLITSAPNGFIFGENVANEMQFFLNYFTSRQLFFAQGKHMWDGMLETVQQGNVNDWIADLMPKVDDYIDELSVACFHMADFYKKSAAKEGADVWGMKIAGWNFPILRLFHTMMPGSKVLYIHRDPVDCIRSAMSAGMIQGSEHVPELAKMYVNNFKEVLENSQLDYLHMINYQELVADPEKVILEIENITGTKGIDRSVMDQRINTFKADIQRDPSGAGYLAPALLSEKDIEVIKEITQEVFELANRPKLV